jgi:hypothetical protein
MFGNSRLTTNPLSTNNGGMQFRFTFGRNSARPNQGGLHFYVPNTFVPNRYSNQFVYQRPPSRGN